ncbi:hypothetical protein NBRC110019_15120 [Neptunitalea chrysea]|uniref:VOC domain-containing protein n=1 Tax=Neptunitalea chrysea TaxID=1647581 RepID=A0A9W6B5Z7_9FLAO|nr:VOC family protein [Neptunitalea chrysea]GLB52472.1 hypothetical protein NBRC110019_15120 [Neptunitalea chrysea]
MKFNNIRLLVNNFDTCFTFYKDTLGLECTWGKLGEAYASFNVGVPSGLCLFKAEFMNMAIDNTDTHTHEHIQDKVALILEVDNVNETYTFLQAKGIAFLTEPKDMTDWGIRVTHFRDPENNLIELFSELSKKQ